MSGTAVTHHAVLTPSKLDLLRAWLPNQPWFTGDASTAEQIGRYRFVDPDGEVGMETILLLVEGRVYQVPLTYRGAPLPDSDEFLVGTMDHSVLGERWCYDAPHDPVYLNELMRVIREADDDAEVVRHDGTQPPPKTMTIEGTGVPAVSDLAGQVRVIRDLSDDNPPTAKARGLLVGTWTVDGVEHEGVLAVLR